MTVFHVIFFVCGVCAYSYIDGEVFYLFLQKQKIGADMMHTPGSTPPRDEGCAESEPAIGDGVGELA